MLEMLFNNSYCQCIKTSRDSLLRISLALSSSIACALEIIYHLLLSDSEQKIEMNLVERCARADS